MKRVQVQLTCDACMAWDGAEVDAEVATVSASGGQTLDLCPVHREAFAPFLALVAEWGDTPGRTASTRSGARRRGSSPSPVVGAPSDAPGTAVDAPRKQRGGKRARARRANATGAPTAVPGSFACPLCTVTVSSPAGVSAHLRTQHNTTASEVYGTVCPVCNHTSATGRALGIHARNHHGLATGVPGLFAQATAAGDPLGVIASRAEVVGQAASV